MYAVNTGDGELVQLLLDHGAKNRLKDWGGAAIIQAISMGSNLVIKILHEKGVLLDGIDQKTLYWATANGHRETLCYLVEQGVSLSAMIEDEESHQLQLTAEAVEWVKQIQKTYEEKKILQSISTEPLERKKRLRF